VERKISKGTILGLYNSSPNIPKKFDRERNNPYNKEN